MNIELLLPPYLSSTGCVVHRTAPTIKMMRLVQTKTTRCNYTNTMVRDCDHVRNRFTKVNERPKQEQRTLILVYLDKVTQASIIYYLRSIPLVQFDFLVEKILAFHRNVIRFV
jgi:hypothetical protein